MRMLIHGARFKFLQCLRRIRPHISCQRTAELVSQCPHLSTMRRCSIPLLFVALKRTPCLPYLPCALQLHQHQNPWPNSFRRKRRQWGRRISRVRGWKEEGSGSRRREKGVGAEQQTGGKEEAHWQTMKSRSLPSPTSDFQAPTNKSSHTTSMIIIETTWVPSGVMVSAPTAKRNKTKETELSGTKRRNVASVRVSDLSCRVDTKHCARDYESTQILFQPIFSRVHSCANNNKGRSWAIPRSDRTSRK